MKGSSILLLTLTVLGLTGAAFGSEGTESPFVFGAGARELALGGAATANSSDATAVFWNPSSLALSQRISLTGMHGDLLIDGAVYQFIGGVIPTLDLGGFGIGLFRQSAQNIDKRDDNNVYLGEFDDSQLRLYLGYGRSLRQFTFGISLSLDHQSVDIYKATSSPGLTLAASYRSDPGAGWLNDLTVTAVARNLIRPGIRLAEETYRYPTILELGGSVRIARAGQTNHLVQPFVTLRKTQALPLQMRSGIEYTYKELLQLRVGHRESNLSFGAGIELGTISFDYAFVDRDLDFVHVFALTGYFGNTVAEQKKNRTEKQEANFRQEMNLQIKKRNLALIDELLTAGQDQLTSKQYDRALGSFDRLIFLARSIGVEVVPYEKLLDSAEGLRSAAEKTGLLNAAIDSAHACMTSGDLLVARYHAQRALQLDPGCDAARELFNEADRALRVDTERAEFLSEQLARIDSLIDRHQLHQAEHVAQSLTEIAPEDDAVMRRINRLELERLRLKIAELESQQTDSSARLAQALTPAGDTDPGRPQATSKEKPIKPISEQQRADLELIYEQAKELFNEGDIAAAVNRWETVAARAPDFLSVREYLVKAYKFLGLELYGQKQRARAIEVWKKALVIDPDNADIAEYIARAESQMKKLKELAHEDS